MMLAPLFRKCLLQLSIKKKNPYDVIGHLRDNARLRYFCFSVHSQLLWGEHARAATVNICIQCWKAVTLHNSLTFLILCL